MKYSKYEIYTLVDELKMSELYRLGDGETKAARAFEAIQMLEALENGELEVIDDENPAESV